jgi:hypothetical protein
MFQIKGELKAIKSKALFVGAGNYYLQHDKERREINDD